jgi:hypothetical protein
MTLRKILDGDVQHVHKQVDTLLDSENGLMLLFDGRRMVSYTHGFGMSGSQLEMLIVEIERSVRNAVGGGFATTRRGRTNREKSKEDDGREGDAVVDQHLGPHERECHSRLVDPRGESVGSGDAGDRDGGGTAGRVLRLASKTA